MTRKRWHFPKYELLLGLIVLVLFLINYKSGTFLLGWDSLSTELNPILGIKRAFFAVWQEYQSFGLVSGMAHASDLIRAIFVWILSFVMPQNIIRYFVHFSLLYVGGVGMMRLLKLVLVNCKCAECGFEASWPARQSVIEPRGLPKLAACARKRIQALTFLGAIFYMFFFPTIQIFYLPFEPFSWFFAALPWLIWIFIRFMNKKNLLIFFVINLLATPAWYVQTLFVVYIMILGLIFLGSLISSRNWREKISNLLTAIFLIIAVNSFWLLPQLYFLKTSGSVVRAAKINQLATEDIYYLNREKGTLAHFARGEGFYYDLIDAKRNPLFEVWQKHFKTPLGTTSQILVVGIILLGFFRKSRYRNSFLLVFLFVATALLSNTFPFLQINELIRKLDFVNQIFRSPFTKFAIPFSLVTAYFFTQGLFFLYEKIKNKRILCYMLHVTCFVLLVFYSLPAFQGFFFSPTMKVKIPNDYFVVMDYFKSQPTDKRIALLPDYTFWGWFFTRWHYDGSGFLWYAVEQPVVSRTFDVWSNTSESYYWEIKAAVEAEDIGRFKSVLKKYDIDYLVLDHSLLPVSATYRGLAYDRLENLLNQSANIFKALDTDNLTVYKIANARNSKNFVETVGSLATVGPKTFVTNFDQSYSDLGAYRNSANPDYYYPFADLTTQTRLKEKNWELIELADSFILKAALPKNLNQYQAILPQTDEKTRFFENGQVATYSAQINARVESDKLVVEIAKDKILDFAPRETKIEDCSFDRSSSKKGTVIIKKNFRSLEIENREGKISCFSFDGPFLSHKYSYLVKIDNENLSGRRLFFYVLDKTKRQSYIEERLKNDSEYFIINPKNPFGLGHSFVFHNNSYEGISSKNILEDVAVYLFPFEELKKIYLVKTKTPEPIITNPRWPSGVQLQPVSTIILNQSFSPGWYAFKIHGGQIKDHFLVNGWANGWNVPVSTNPDGVGNQLEPVITILFLPQLLEFAGFGLLAFTLIWIILISPCFFVKSSLESKHE